ncbi:MAG TPA: CYTH and CHAD domain-containing protein [Candidatus Dormibacteraeota bacterium]|jgi:CHAD domain-containing protein|nr:CYTH and CHAD domain-containing protein [Candidatus Dormibacteraeota bacterium]
MPAPPRSTRAAKPETEREVKMEVAPQFSLPDLGGVTEGLTASEPRHKRMHTVYWDTRDLRLARWGCSLRHREGEGWTVKLPGSVEGRLLVRGEHTFPGAAKLPAAEAVDLVRAYLRSAALEPVATLRTHRVAVDLRDAEGAAVAEVVDDEVSVLDGRRIAIRFRQLEIEVGESASAELVEAVVGRLREAGAGEPDPTPKHVRALGPRATAAPELAVADAGPPRSAAEVVRAALASSVVRLLRHDVGVRLGGDSEEVHQARVATRRLRSDMRTFGRLLDEPWADSLRDELGWLADLLGAVRDTDVLLERTRARVAELGEEGQRLRPLLRRLAEERGEARARLLAAMRDGRYVALLDRLVAAAQAPAFVADAGELTIEELPAMAARPWRRLRDAVRRLGTKPTEEELHTVRIAAKRCRYAAEALIPAIGADARRFAGAVAGLQGVLGDHHDAVVAGAWLRRVAPELSAASAFVAGRVSVREERLAAESAGSWRAAWKKLDRRRLTGWMAG